ncbi:hypothetical protein E4U17_001074 [Claviceps sp. LM77 group G4]|nr:hypothetical protein E4U17_001074 [Claviceps sp. LM77 group G4]KAG6084972.1 hypothetical protein E4U16_000427 [Claviceps sp. LM84 group G4]
MVTSSATHFASAPSLPCALGICHERIDITFSSSFVKRTIGIDDPATEISGPNEPPTRCFTSKEFQATQGANAITPDALQ